VKREKEAGGTDDRDTHEGGGVAPGGCNACGVQVGAEEWVEMNLWGTRVEHHKAIRTERAEFSNRVDSRCSTDHSSRNQLGGKEQ
jgi:hypothetical protein